MNEFAKPYGKSEKMWSTIHNISITQEKAIAIPNTNFEKIRHPFPSSNWFFYLLFASENLIWQFPNLEMLFFRYNMYLFRKFPFWISSFESSLLDCTQEVFQKDQWLIQWVRTSDGLECGEGGDNKNDELADICPNAPNTYPTGKPVFSLDSRIFSHPLLHWPTCPKNFP